MSYKAFVAKLMKLEEHLEKAQNLSENWKETKKWAVNYWAKKIVKHLDQHPNFVEELNNGRSI
jgi:hypothetical protein